MGILEEIREKQTDILEITGKHYATDVRLFGSVARGDAGSGSDVDLVVRFLSHATLFDYIAIVRKLESLLARKVDVVCETALYEGSGERLASEAVSLETIEPIHGQWPG